jgi:hypothetical protein
MVGGGAKQTRFSRTTSETSYPTSSRESAPSSPNTNPSYLPSADLWERPTPAQSSCPPLPNSPLSSVPPSTEIPTTSRSMSFLEVLESVSYSTSSSTMESRASIRLIKSRMEISERSCTIRLDLPHRCLLVRPLSRSLSSSRFGGWKSRHSSAVRWSMTSLSESSVNSSPRL